MAGYDRSEVEDVTGCIPLLLDKCTLGGKVDLAVDDLARHLQPSCEFCAGNQREDEGKLVEMAVVCPTYSTLETLLTFQVCRVREGLHLSHGCTLWKAGRT